MAHKFSEEQLQQLREMFDSLFKPLQTQMSQIATTSLKNSLAVYVPPVGDITREGATFDFEGQQYKVGKKLGSGEQGCVMRDALDHSQAIKVLKADSENAGWRELAVANEIRQAKKDGAAVDQLPDYRHVGRVRVHDGTTTLIVMKKYEKYTHSVDGLKGVLPALHQLHELGYAHNDLYNANICKEGGNPILVDFGGAVPIDRKHPDLGGNEPSHVLHHIYRGPQFTGPNDVATRILDLHAWAVMALCYFTGATQQGMKQVAAKHYNPDNLNTIDAAFRADLTPLVTLKGDKKVEVVANKAIDTDLTREAQYSALTIVAQDYLLPAFKAAAVGSLEGNLDDASRTKWATALDTAMLKGGSTANDVLRDLA